MTAFSGEPFLTSKVVREGPFPWGSGEIVVTGLLIFLPSLSNLVHFWNPGLGTREVRKQCFCLLDRIWELEGP